jgi:ABC-type transport system substrate-binding protein
MRQLILGAAFALVIATAASAQERTLVVAAPAAPVSLEPGRWLPGMIESVVNVYEGLTRYSTKPGADGRPQVDPNRMEPHLAESWTVSEDGRTYTFKLRPGVRSPYGNEISADDVVWGWELTEDHTRTDSFLKRVSLVDRVEKVSEREVRFILKAPNRIFLMVLATYAPTIFDTKEVRKHATAGDPKALDWLKTNTAGYGAYHLLQLRQGQGATWVVNPNYAFAKPFYTRIVYREVPSPANRVALVKNGDVQWAEDIPIGQLGELMKDPKVRVESVPGTGSASLRINPNKPPLDDRRVRQAIAYALDYKTIGDLVFRGASTRARSLLAPIHPGVVESFPYDTDIAKAKQLLAAAGHPNGLKLTLDYSDNWWWEEPIAVQAKDALAKAGIELELKRLPKTEFQARRLKRDLAFFPHLSNAFILDPIYAFNLTTHSKGSSNFMGYASQALDSVLDRAMVERDDARYHQLVGEAQRVLDDDAVALYTYFPGTFVVMSPCIRGWLWRPHDRTVWRELRCES